MDASLEKNSFFQTILGKKSLSSDAVKPAKNCFRLTLIENNIFWRASLEKGGHLCSCITIEIKTHQKKSIINDAAEYSIKSRTLSSAGGLVHIDIEAGIIPLSCASENGDLLGKICTPKNTPQREQ